MTEPAPGPAPTVSHAVDFEHLARQTMGDRALEMEVLALFRGQSARLVAALQAADAADKPARDMAHTLIGAARGIGAFGVAEAAARVEAAAAEGFRAAVENLAGAVSEARLMIERRLAQA